MKLEHPIQLLPDTTKIVLEDSDDRYYSISFKQGDNLIIVCGQDSRKPIVQKLHSLIMQGKLTCSGQVNTIMEFKHYRKNGSKFSSTIPGVEFYFCIPKKHIRVLPKMGHSFVYVEINGVEVCLNVCGGTTYENNRHGWQDRVGEKAVSLVGMSLKNIISIAAVAIPSNLPSNVVPLEGERLKVWQEMTNKKDDQRTVLQAFMDKKIVKVALASRYNYMGEKSGILTNVNWKTKWKKIPLTDNNFTMEEVETKRIKGLVLNTPFGQVRVKPSQVDWQQSASFLS